MSLNQRKLQITIKIAGEIGYIEEIGRHWVNVNREDFNKNLRLLMQIKDAEKVTATNVEIYVDKLNKMRSDLQQLPNKGNQTESIVLAEICKKIPTIIRLMRRRYRKSKVAPVE